MTDINLQEELEQAALDAWDKYEEHDKYCKRCAVRSAQHGSPPCPEGAVLSGKWHAACRKVQEAMKENASAP